ncbi:hypothetical protein LWM68_24500 [Niabella sp. W65]|nr:hypothetical protein [Niabella sp. W65]MCH7365657.1 hypothetical protein [Niabella sp. W65]
MKFTIPGLICIIMAGLLHAQQPLKVSEAEMQKVYDEVKTPYKYGLVLLPPDTGKRLTVPLFTNRATPGT